MNNKQLLLAAFLLVASSFVDAASVRDNSKKNFLRRDLTEIGASRELKSKSQKDSNGGGVPTRAPVPTPAPVKTVTSLNDWINDCRGGSNRVDDCVIVGGASSPFNCKMCLKSLSFTIDPVVSSPGVEACADSITCRGCSADEIRPFFGCGLDVDDAFSGGGTTPVPVPVTPAPITTTPPAPPPPTAQPTSAVKIDTINCPFELPGSGNACVMLAGFDFKQCTYPENGPDAVCGCSKYQPIWLCTGITISDPAAASGALMAEAVFSKGKDQSEQWPEMIGGIFAGAAICYFCVTAFQNYKRRKDYQQVPVDSLTI